MKECSICKEIKSLEHYCKDSRRSKDGLRGYCRPCKSIMDRDYRLRNKESIRKRSNNYAKNRRNSDPLYRLVSNCRSSIYKALKSKGYSKNSKTIEILGCEWSYLKNYLESKFDENMTWDNYGKYWDVDHIIPLSSGKTLDEIKKLSHYTNLQPLESTFNRFVKRNLILENYKNV